MPLLFLLLLFFLASILNQAWSDKHCNSIAFYVAPVQWLWGALPWLSLLLILLFAFIFSQKQSLVGLSSL